MKSVQWRVLTLIALLSFLMGCMNAQPNSEIYFLRQKPSEAPDMAALFGGRLVLSETCLYVQSEDVNSSYAAIWPFEFSLAIQDDSIQILNGGKEVVARVGERIRVSGGEIPQLPLEDFEENFIGSATQCTAPYWVINNDVEVLTP